MRRLCCALVLVLVCLPVHFARGQTTRPVPEIERVLIISIDGCRPDLLLRANTPVVHGLLPKASFSFWARTTAESVTLPSHTSMLTGVPPLEHVIYPAYPTLFQLAKQAGYTTAMAAGKGKFVALAVPGSLDWQSIPDKEKSEDPQVMFVHLPTVDNVGHAQGWATAAQLAAIEQADACIGRILNALAEEKVIDQTLVIVTADHDGAGRIHGPDDPRSRHIPWIAAGPGVRQNLDLTTNGELVIDTEDTFATACYVLGIPVMRRVDGKPITQIVRRDELLQAK